MTRPRHGGSRFWRVGYSPTAEGSWHNLLELDRMPSAAEAELVAEIVRIHASKLTGNLLVVEPARVRVRPLPR
jgi:hypothetical protein